MTASSLAFFICLIVWYLYYFCLLIYVMKTYGTKPYIVQSTLKVHHSIGINGPSYIDLFPKLQVIGKKYGCVHLK